MKTKITLHFYAKSTKMNANGKLRIKSKTCGFDKLGI